MNNKKLEYLPQMLVHLMKGTWILKDPLPHLQGFQDLLPIPYIPTRRIFKNELKWANKIPSIARQDTNIEGWLRDTSICQEDEGLFEIASVHSRI